MTRANGNRGFFRLTAAAVLLTLTTSAHVEAQEFREKVRPVPPLQGKYAPMGIVMSTDDARGSDDNTTIGFVDTTRMEGGWSILGLLAKDRRSVGAVPEPVGLVVRKHPAYKGALEPLADVTSVTRVWGLTDHGGWIIYRANAPDGYYAVGDFFIGDNNENPGYRKNYKAVHNSLLLPLNAQPAKLWSDVGTGARDNGSIWGVPPINNRTLPFSRSFYDSTHDNAWQLFKGTPNYEAPTGAVLTLNPDMIELLPSDTATPDATKLNLLTTYAPLLKLAPGEEYMPCSTEFLLNGSTQGRDDDGHVWLFLNKVLDSPSDDTYPVFAGDLANAKVYAFWSDSPAGVNLNYFFFYGYNRGKNVAGSIYGNHMGDIEHMIVRLEKRAGNWVPTLSYYAAHADGQTFPWDQVDKVGGTHPVVYSAKGSHGCYAKAGDRHYGDALGTPLIDNCSDGGTQWETWNHLVAYDYHKRSNLSGGTYPTWMGPGPREIYRWGNPEFKGNAGDSIVSGLTMLFKPSNKGDVVRFTDGPLGPQYKNCWGTALD